MQEGGQRNLLCSKSLHKTRGLIDLASEPYLGLPGISEGMWGRPGDLRSIYNVW